MLSPRFSLGLRSSGILLGVSWWLVTDVSGKPVGPICKGQEAQKDCPHTSVTSYQRKPRKFPEELRLSFINLSFRMWNGGS
jgi:hypothetical protein